MEASTPTEPTLYSAITGALLAVDPRAKAKATRALAQSWQGGQLPLGEYPMRWPSPAARAKPIHADPTSMPKRGLGSVAGRAALLHAVAHIELNAIDLALDMIGRFTRHLSASDQAEFVSDWVSVADDEARHFVLVADRLSELGTSYGDLPAHSGLWDAARRTSEDVLARLAIAPMVLEARGLDVTPQMIGGFQRAKDEASADVLSIIYDEEVGHVAIGTKWFRRLCKERDLKPNETFSQMVALHFPGGLKKPFNHDARTRSDFPRDWYEGLVEGDNPVRL